MQIVPVTYDDVDAIQRIGELRAAVWRGEGVPFQCQSDGWTDAYDALPTCHHWVILDGDGSQIVACARLTVHACADHHDIKLFAEHGHALQFPVAVLGRLVVAAPFRRRGYAQQLHQVRIQAAKDLGCASIVVTATEINVHALLKMGFAHLMQHGSPVTVTFDNRPSTVFYAMHCVMP
jgi:predicted GNAT family N-acyltransferase